MKADMNTVCSVCGEMNGEHSIYDYCPNVINGMYVGWKDTKFEPVEVSDN